VAGEERDVVLGRRKSGCVNYGESERVDRELKGCHGINFSKITTGSVTIFGQK